MLGWISILYRHIMYSSHAPHHQPAHLLRGENAVLLYGFRQRRYLIDGEVLYIGLWLPVHELEEKFQRFRALRQADNVFRLQGHLAARESVGPIMQVSLMNAEKLAIA